MTDYKIFYSWQSDLPNATNRGFIEKALKRAAKSIRDDKSIQVELVVDRDTIGVPGAPDIASTILAKIEQAKVFVCDVSIIKQETESRPTPNPNVLLELGYALKALGQERVIIVMNSAYGGLELLPFDLRLKRVITYNMAESNNDRSPECKKLEKSLEQGLRTILKNLERQLPSDLIHAYLEKVASQRIENLLEDNLYLDREAQQHEEQLHSRSVSYFKHDSEDEKKFSQPEPLDRIVDHESKVILLGEPGIGKTTSLQHLARDAARRILSHSVEASDYANETIPIYAELKTYRGESLEAWLAEQVEKVLKRCGRGLGADLNERTRKIDSWLKSNDKKFLILLDGLNEVPNSYRENICNELKSWFQYPPQIVVSCREREYDESLSAFGKSYVMRGLSEEEVKEYLFRSLGEAGHTLYEDQIKKDYKIKSLVSNPFMLQIISLISRDDPTIQLPRNRGLLFEKLTQVMPRLRRQDGTVDKVSLPVVFLDLKALGYYMRYYNKLSPGFNDVSQWTFQETHPLEEVLAQAKNWRFLKSDGRLGEPIEFLHQLFVEYFAAAALKHGLDTELTLDRMRRDAIFHDDWEEVIEMLAGIHDQPTEFIKWLGNWILKDKDRYLDIHNRRIFDTACLLYRCWRTTKTLESNEETKDIVVKALLIAMHTSNPITPVGDALEDIGGKLIIDSLASELQNASPDSNSLFGMRALFVLKRIGDTSVIKPLLNYYATRSDREIERNLAVEAIVAILEREEFDSLAVEAFTSALEHSNPRLRALAAHLLGEGGVVEALPKLDSLAVNDLEKTLWGKVADVANEAARKIRQQ